MLLFKTETNFKSSNHGNKLALIDMEGEAIGSLMFQNLKKTDFRTELLINWHNLICILIIELAIIVNMLCSIVPLKSSKPINYVFSLIQKNKRHES